MRRLRHCPRCTALLSEAALCDDQRGEEFNKLSWVEDITDDKDDRSRLFRDIRVEGDVNRNEPGTYELAYYAADSDGKPLEP